jgi:class 3 adenylate cyclase/tetratricopeptide (TPR) repeat protein
MDVTCTACGSGNPAGNRFCGQCAAALSLACPACGTTVAAGQKFCGQCAAPLTSQPAEAPSAELPAADGVGAAENRLVSVLFVDLVGFTTLSETRDAEDVRELLSGYFDLARTIVGRYGGTVEKFIGDAVMAVWGVPYAHEDDAERAVRAALDVVEGVAAYGAECGAPDLRARAGVVTGPVAAWAAPGEGLVAGDRVNTASRVQSIAEPGTVYVDDVTRRVSLVAIAYADVGEHSVKGKAEPLRLWRAERVVAGVGGSVRVDGLEARFIGRDPDLRLVKELFHACIDRGTARLVSVTGAAGVGKSRLRWEFDKYVDGLAGTVLWHVGRCLSYGEGVAYRALAEMVRQRFNIAEEDGGDVVAERLDDGLLENITDPAEREFLRARIGVLLGLPGVELNRDELFAGWRLFFERLAEQLPVALVFEDLHWADPGLLDFIDQLLDWSGGHPIFILTFARPELADRRAGWATGRRNATTLYLEPLPTGVIAALLDDLVAGLPEAVRDRIVESSEGIPLYAMETVRSLIDRDIVVPREGVYTLVGEVGELDVPTSLASLIAARLDALTTAERSLVQDLSVLGGGFSRAAIGAISGIPDDDLDEVLASLVRKELLTVRTDKLSPDRGQYVFAQTVLRTVAYDMLSKKQRKSRHLAVAAHLRATFDDDGEDVAEVVAAHYREALLAAENDPDVEQIRHDTIAAYGRAGQRAAALGSPVTAGGMYRTAAELATEEDDRLELLAHAVDMAISSGEHQIAFDLVTALRADYDQLGRHEESARLAVRHARACARLGRTDDAVVVLQEAMPLLEAAGETPDLVNATGWLANFLVFNGRAIEAEPHSERSLVLSQALGLPGDLGQALGTRAVILTNLDRYEEAMIHVEAAVELARSHDLSDLEQNALITASDLFMCSDAPRAADLAEAAVASSRRRGNAYSESIAASNLLYVLAYKGEWERADALLAELLNPQVTRPDAELLYVRMTLLEGWRGNVAATADAFEHAASLVGRDSVDDRVSYDAALAVYDNCAERFDDALRNARKVIDHLGEGVSVRHEALRIAWTEAIEAAFSLRDPEGAQQLAAVVGDLKPGLIPPYCRATLLRTQARLDAASGEDATATFHAAEGIFDQLGYTYWLARTRLDHAQWLASQGSGSDAAELGKLAAAAFDTLRAPSWSERARALDAAAAAI